MNGTEFSIIVEVAPRTGARWLAAIRDGDIAFLTPEALGRLVRYEQAQSGSSTIVEALIGQAARTAIATDAAAVAKCITSIAASLQQSSNLIERMAGDIADGSLSPDEARRLLPLLENATAIAQTKCRALMGMAHGIRRSLAPKSES